MTSAKYSFQGMKEDMAKAMKRDVELSLKVAIEMANFLRGKKTSEAKTILERVLNMTQAIPFKRFKDGVGHRKGKGIASGRYPQKGSAIFLELIKAAETNAQAKGLSSDLKIIHLAAQKSSGAFHSGRSGRRKFKRAHLEIVVQEIEKDSRNISKAKKQEATSETPDIKEPKKNLPEQNQHNHEHAKEHNGLAESNPEKESAPKKKRVVKKTQEDKR